MRFAQPLYLWLLLPLVLTLSLFLLWAWRKKQALIAQFVQSRLLGTLTVGVSAQRQKARFALLVLAVGCLMLALARPQYGFDWEEAHQKGLDIIVALDTSRSMLAEDLAPNRLARAKLAALDLMQLSQSDRLGLVAFAGSAFLQCPLTLDEQAFRQSVEALDTSIIPQGGTALPEALNTALAAFEKGDDNHKVVILFTDGEDHEGEGNTLEVVEKVAKEGIKIFTIGVGSSEGEMLRVPDEGGQKNFLKDDDGNAVKSRLNEGLLQRIATAAGGFYLPLRGARPVETLYEKGLAPLPKGDSKTKLVKQYRERFHWPLALALLLLVAEMFLPQSRRAKRPEPPKGPGTTAGQAAAVGLVLLAAAGALQASPGQAMKSYQDGKFDEALAEYERLLEKRTNDHRLSFNAGDAAYKAGQFEQARKHFETAVVSPDFKLQEQAYYNLGNTHYQAGEAEQDPQAKTEAWEKAVQQYEYALKLEAQDADARSNLEFVKQKLEELKQQQQQDQDKDQKDDKEQKDKDQKDQKDQKNQDKKDQKQDQQKQDQKQDQKDKKEEQKQQDQQKQDAKDKSDEQKQQQAQDKKEQEKKDKEKQQQSAQSGKDEKKDQPKPEEQAEGQAMGVMSMQQALRFLEAQKQDEQPLIFAPPKTAEQEQKRIKDW